MRIFDNGHLFSSGAGISTYGNIKCEWCGKKYQKRENEEGEAISDVAICVDFFGDKQICECCFEKVEKAVLQNISRIIAWYEQVLELRGKLLDRDRENLNKLKKHIKEGGSDNE